MAIAWRTDYALRIMYETARLGEGGMASVSVLAECADVPYDFARQIANRLSHQGLLRSKRGARGGFLLARPADEITMLDVFVAMDERPTMSLCTHSEHVCARQELCPVHNALWLQLDDVIERHLSGLTLAQAVAVGDKLAEEACAEGDSAGA